MEMLVFQDAAGDYFVMPRKAWEQARVPRNRRGEVEKLLGAGQKVQAVQGKRPVKLEDLGPRGLTGERAKKVKAGAVQPVGSFTTTAPISPSLASINWGKA